MPGDLSLDKTLPHNLEAERSVLGAILLENRSIHEAVLNLRPEHFFRESHQKIYAAMLELYESRRAIDLITIPEILDRGGHLDLCGGPAYVASLVDGVPPSEHISYWIEVVKSKALLRQLIHVSGSTMNAAFEAADDPAALLERAGEAIFHLSQSGMPQGFASMPEVLDGLQPMLERYAEERSGITGLATRYFRLDDLLAGLQPGDLILLAARPSVGKTAFALNIAQNVALAERPATVAIFSLEMTKEQLVQRLLCGVGHIDGHMLRRGFLSPGSWEKLREAQSKLYDAPIFIDDTPGITTLEMRAKARRLKAERGLDLVVVDYLQLMSAPQRRSENRVQEVSYISRSLKEMAKELRCPVLALSQLRRMPVGREESRPQLSDLRESGSLEQDADVVIFLSRKLAWETDQREEKSVAEVIVAKQRNGPTDAFPLVFLDSYARFENMDQARPGEPPL